MSFLIFQYGLLADTDWALWLGSYRRNGSVELVKPDGSFKEPVLEVSLIYLREKKIFDWCNGIMID